MTRVISIINLKGGVGKTFTAANMAHILNNQGKRVLLVDNDKQGNLSKLFGVYQDVAESGTEKLLRGWYKNINDIRTVLPGYACLDIVPANMSLLRVGHIHSTQPYVPRRQHGRRRRNRTARRIIPPGSESQGRRNTAASPGRTVTGANEY